MDQLTPFQHKIIRAISKSPLRDQFYLTGGTALSVFYLQHRYSLDLDFFTADPTSVARAPAIIEKIAREINAQVSFTRQLGTFLQCFFESKTGERVQIDFAQESPYRLGKTLQNDELGIEIENFEDIACNKLSALFDRAEAKDFVDVYFICQEKMPFNELVEKAKKKHLGLDDYWLAIALQQAAEIEILPRMIKEFSLDELKKFFSEEAKKLMAGINS
ncbi:MAG: hypothetical protein B6I38_01595 [Anaerolineaceae bacterium 4572_5.1]|nr:MAG: hypothetical protein B6I38_01595 [Anaerolineaceae bacterium 4572_5.1]